MAPAFSSITLTASLALLLMILVGRRDVFRFHRQMALFFGVYLVDNLAIALTNHFPQLQILQNHVWGGFLLWGWSGKLYSIVLVLILVCLSQGLVSWRDAGLTLQQYLGSLAPSLVLLFLTAAAMSVWGSMFPKGESDPGLLLYLAILPGLNEELVYRGVLPACLTRAFGKPWSLASARFGCSILIPTFMFALLHGVWFDGAFVLHVDMVLIRNALISGVLFAWLRERTGSLIMPILAHGAWDFFFFLPRML